MYCVYQLKNDRGEVYYGMTKDPKGRLQKHRVFNYNYCTSVILWEDGGVVDDIEVLDWFDTEELALEREKELIRNNNCVNIIGKYTRQEQKKMYRENNKEQILASEKKFRENNKEKINARATEKIKCDVCGSMTTRGHKARHQQSDKCKSFNECEQ